MENCMMAVLLPPGVRLILPPAPRRRQKTKHSGAGRGGGSAKIIFLRPDELFINQASSLRGAKATKQSSLRHASGSLRFARNDEMQVIPKKAPRRALPQHLRSQLRPETEIRRPRSRRAR